MGSSRSKSPFTNASCVCDGGQPGESTSVVHIAAEERTDQRGAARLCRCDEVCVVAEVSWVAADKQTAEAGRGPVLVSEAIALDREQIERVESFLQQRIVAESLKRSSHTSASVPEGELAAEDDTDEPPAPVRNLCAQAEPSGETCKAILRTFGEHPGFALLAKQLGDEASLREEGERARNAKWTQFAVSQGNILGANIVLRASTHPVQKVDVTQEAPEAVAERLVSLVGGGAAGRLITLQGPSGTGKRSVVAALQETLPSLRHWRLGGLFRALALLALAYAEQRACALADALGPRLLEMFFEMLHLTEDFDVKIEGVGLSHVLSDIEASVLMEARVSAAVAKVAALSQGYVIKFVTRAARAIVGTGHTLLLEGNGPTLEFLETPHRFQLVVGDNDILGQRKAAQMLASIASPGGQTKIADDPSVALGRAAAPSLGGTTMTPRSSRTSTL